MSPPQHCIKVWNLSKIRVIYSILYICQGALDNTKLLSKNMIKIRNWNTRANYINTENFKICYNYSQHLLIMKENRKMGPWVLSTSGVKVWNRFLKKELWFPSTKNKWRNEYRYCVVSEVSVDNWNHYCWFLFCLFIFNYLKKYSWCNF
jgi:hypothetical protein